MADDVPTFSKTPGAVRANKAVFYSIKFSMRRCCDARPDFPVLLPHGVGTNGVTDAMKQQVFATYGRAPKWSRI